MLNAQQIAELEFNIDNVWSLSDYLSHINAEARQRMAETPGLWCSEFVEELEHWNEVEIHTARDLANYLDACYEKEVRKAQMDSYWDQYDEILEVEAKREAAEEDAARQKYVQGSPQGGVTLGDIWPR